MNKQNKTETDTDTENNLVSARGDGLEEWAKWGKGIKNCSLPVIK